MKKPDDIKKSIRECLGFHSDCEDVCDACPYWDEGPFCKGALCRDAIACIDQLEKKLSVTMNERKQLISDLGNMVKYVGNCDFCKYEDDPEAQCQECGLCNWEWRGVPDKEEES